MNKVKHMKKVTSFLLLLVTALLLVACSPKENVPYGSLTDEKYLSVGDNVTVTEKELYDTLRRESSSTLEKILMNKVLEDYKQDAIDLLAVEGALEDTREHLVQTMFDDNVNTNLFGTNDLDVIRKFSEINRHLAIEGFVNGLHQNDANVDRDLVRSELVNIFNHLNDTDFKAEYYNVEAIKNAHLLEIQKHLYAEEKLKEDILDEENSVFIKDSHLIAHFKNEVKNDHEVKVFFFHFQRLDEAEAVLRSFDMKASQTGYFYEVLPIRTYAEYQINGDEEAVKNALKKAGLEHLFDEVTGAHDYPELSEEVYKRYYDNYNVNNLDEGDRMLNHEILEKFVLIYNKLNELPDGSNGLVVDAYDQNTIFSDLTINFTRLDGDGNNVEYETLKTYKDLLEINSSFANLVYNTLNEDKPYSDIFSPGSGTRRYLVFKLSEDKAIFDFVSETKDKDKNEKLVTVEELKALAESTVQEDIDKLLASLGALLDRAVLEAELEDDALWTAVQTAMDEAYDEWKATIKKDRLTSAYTNRVINNLFNDAKIEIYDEMVRTYFNKDNNAKGSNKTGNVVAKITVELFGEEKSFEVLVDEFYAKLEASHGLQTALDLAFNKIVYNEYKNKPNGGIFKDYMDEIDEKQFKEDYEEMIRDFSNDAYAQAGYPVSIGREAFLQLIFGTKDKNEIIKTGFVYPKLRSLFFENYELSLPHLTDAQYFDVLFDYTNKSYEKYKGVKVQHLLVYFDIDGDGSPDNPHEIFDDLTNDQIDLIKDEVINIYTELINYITVESIGSKDSKVTASEYSKLSEKFISEYNKTVRVELPNADNNSFITAKKLGLNLKFEDISSTITNTSNFPTGSSTLDKVFYDRAIELHDLIADAREDAENNGETLKGEGLPHFDFAGSLNNLTDLDGLVAANLDNILSDFGFHFILVENITDKVSAKYNASLDSQGRYKFDHLDVTYDVYNTDDEITLEQIKYYIIGKQYNASVPNAVQKALNEYFLPVYNSANNNNMKQAMFFKYINDLGLNLHGKDARFNEIVQVNQDQFFKYMNTAEGLYDPTDSLYNDWKYLNSNWFVDFGLNN